jgi:hypothetical protein
MRTAVLTRQRTGDDGTFGQMVLDDGTKFYTGELPWRDNQRGKSCIPPGVYLCQWLLSPRHGWCFHVTGVQGRSEIEIHSANWFGDKNVENPSTHLPYLCELEGCISLGTTIGPLKGQLALLDSRHAIEGFENNLKRADNSHEPFQLILHGIQEPVASVLGGEID